jgi:beta-lactamase regulating signal transducer with metallopeptidase domain
MPPLFSIPLLPADWRELVASRWSAAADPGTAGVSERDRASNGDDASAPETVAGADDVPQLPAAAATVISQGPTAAAVEFEVSRGPAHETGEIAPTAVAEASPAPQADMPDPVAGRAADIPNRRRHADFLPERADPSPGARIEEFCAQFLSRILIGSGTVGTVLMMLVQLIRIVRMHRLLKRSVPAPAELESTVGTLAAQMNVRPPRARLSSDIQSPLVCALGRSVLLWPASRADGLPAGGRQAVLLHELAHLARHDHWVGWLELVATCFWWWNPLFWYVRHQLRENSELACDAWVMGLLPEGRRAYARALVDLAELNSRNRFPAPALGIGDGSRTLFERRLVMIMGDGVRYRLGAGGLIGVGLLALMTLPGCSTGQAADELVPSEAVNIAAPPDAPLVETAGSSSSDPQDPLFPAVPESAPKADPFSPATQPRGTTSEQELPARAEPFAPALELPAEATPSKVGTSSADERIQRLEERFEALLKELHELKKPSVTALPDPSQNKDPNSAKASDAQNFQRSKLAKPGAGPTPGNDFRVSQQVNAPLEYAKQYKEYTKLVQRADGETERINLTRATYKLPPGRAQAIAAFLTQNLTDEIEVRVKGDGLQVTASEEDQSVLGQFLRLLQTRGAVEPKSPSPKDTPDTGRDGNLGIERPGLRGPAVRHGER